ncbi:MAG TPA: hypothetical protein VGJ42_03770 [Nitrososphaera sp.]
MPGVQKTATCKSCGKKFLGPAVNPRTQEISDIDKKRSVCSYPSLLHGAHALHRGGHGMTFIADASSRVEDG